MAMFTCLHPMPVSPTKALNNMPSGGQLNGTMSGFFTKQTKTSDSYGKAIRVIS
jgi:hypothetical protein